MTKTITIDIPDRSYQRLVQTAEATKQPLDAIILRVLEIGSPPDWTNIPEEFQTEIAALDRLDDNTLWRIARGQKKPEEMIHYDELLAKNKVRQLTNEERLELTALRKEADLFMLRKAQAIVLLRWRGHQIMNIG
ncbi:MULTISPECIES: hypothetical protein [Spirulina sp. CCY15215]|uniref:hypothetical protein n=1 Tax=Spirulina sp. CCY15215 TaxID=2767591 RepID=UPI00195128D7|nr:hypothetical protein [Spirulina major]